MTAPARALRAAPPEPPDVEAPPPDDWPTTTVNGHTRATDHPPIWDRAAERATLGAILHGHPPTTTEIFAALNPDDFHNPAHELIAHAAHHTHFRGEPVDPITITSRLTATGDLERAGGPAYLHQLVADTPSATAGPWYAQIVAEHATRRRLQTAATRIQQLAQRTAPRRPDEGPEGPDALAALHEAAENALTTARRVIPGIEPPRSTWAAMDLTAALGGHDPTPRPTTLTLRDGTPLLYPAAVHSVAGEPGSGKSWVATVGAAQELTAGRPATYIDFEDHAGTLIARLRWLGVTDEQLATNLRYIRPDTPLTPATTRDLLNTTNGCQLVVVDGITEAMTLHGLSYMDNEDVARWLAIGPRTIADQGAAVLQVDHVTKNPDTRGRYAIGGQHKLAGISGAAYKLLTIRPFARGRHGHAKLIIDKDRHGHVGPVGHTVADFHLDATDPHQLYGWLETGEPAPVNGEGEFRPTIYMARISKMLQAAPGMTFRSIKDSLRGKDAVIRAAIEALINEGHLRIEAGPNRSHLHYVITPFEEDAE